ncbi:helix-turn-helix domain-containing protein [Streptomyces sp. WMMC500]|uniref:IclR family transcriptional regulator domain-containing protein n=1 Tax=Streptomyces sp. WMMC500 TaxID=3015154 RepID=UPI00248D2EFF|nr:IclR family transcriptional regulator C-terminal domain-containing protein [Streptomyces sp. WMMC500]WBB61852.1 helix-turn-helix domain-containing protein [Streptomyces sp. WMMC500]
MPPPHTATAPHAGSPPAEAVEPLMRGIAVLRRLTDSDGGLSLPELERATGLVRSTLDRITGTLAWLGYLGVDGRDVHLAPRLLELGNAYLAALRLPDLLGPCARELARELDESVSLAVPDGDGIRFIHQTTRRRALSVSFCVGDLLPAECAAPGLLTAADWSERDWAHWRRRRSADPLARGFPALPPREAGQLATQAEFAARARRAGEQGWALDDQLVEPGLVALSVPVRDPAGGLACVASLVSHTSRHSAEDLHRLHHPALRAAVGEMQRRLREAPHPEPAPEGPRRAPALAVAKRELGRGFVESMARGLTVLTAFGAGREELTLAAVARSTGLARATARRALLTLAHLGYVVDDAGVFRLTPRVLSLGYPPLSRLTLPQLAQPHLAALTERVHDSTSVAVLDGDDVRYTARKATKRIMSVEITVGTRFPAYATSMGRVLLAGLPEVERLAYLDRADIKALTRHTVTDREKLAALLDRVAETGYALVDEELEEGVRSMAVPVADGSGRAVAAVNVAMHTGRRSMEECVTQILPELRAAADAITADLRIAGRFARVSAT